jgi:hypothetical protein
LRGTTASGVVTVAGVMIAIGATVTGVITAIGATITAVKLFVSLELVFSFVVEFEVIFELSLVLS